MGDRSGMSISADSPSDETLNLGPLALRLGRRYEFPFRIDIVQFSFFQFFIDHCRLYLSLGDVFTYVFPLYRIRIICPFEK